ncbi:MAG: hypothetical protein JWM11_1698, partial [Planctomycetaceae bacterium]|nr:hypothetical protein [Planctomycetaceae bacterium]
MAPHGLPDTSNAGLITRTSAGDLPDWTVADMPEPLPFNVVNLFKTIGPGAILLATSIGAGELLAGPANGVKYGLSIFWIATVAIVLQTLFNLEGIRYTLYTGEPILTGIMRLRPGSKIWSGMYSFLTIVQLGVPALAKLCGPVVFAGLLGRLAGKEDQGLVLVLSYVVMALAVLLLSFGGTIERMLEHLSWAMIVYIFTFLIIANLMFVPASHWQASFFGFFPVHTVVQLVTGQISAGSLMPEVKFNDLLLLGTLAATAGAGGIGNLTISNWFRDKGMGMGKLVGSIGTAVGAEQHTVAPTGVVFPITPDNMRRWKTWWNYAQADQVWLWGLGCFIGIYLNVNLATWLIPVGANMDGSNAAMHQVETMSKYWPGFWYLALLNAFWILFSTHLGNTDVMVRTVTDMWWVASPKVREKSNGKISTLYYTILAAVTAWSCFAILSGEAMALFKFLGFIANL